jgi:hypothetical protein
MRDLFRIKNSAPLLAMLLGCLATGCSGEPKLAEGASVSRTPLQPLIYTELPDLTAAAAAVRERRLLRELLHGTEKGKEWGRLQHRENLPAPTNEEELGQLLAQALIARDEAKWDHAFVSPASYAGMVRVDLEDARKFVDELQGSSMPTWRMFDIEHASEAPEGGLASILEFHSLELGQGRTVSGKIAKKDAPVEQHWGNTLRLKLKGQGEVLFELRIPKILRVSDRRKLATGEPLLVVASAIDASKRLETFFDAGLHLKPELLRSQEYPYPLSVGNFWRYRRFNKGKSSQAERDPMAIPSDVDTQANFAATDVLLEILGIERYGSLRLVKYRTSYNDTELTVRERNWIVTPRRIYDCGRNCSRHVEDLGWLLDHLSRDTPRYHFPLVWGEGWGEEGESYAFDKAPVRVLPNHAEVEVPAGTFSSAVVIESPSGTILSDPFITVSSGKRVFMPGKGIVRLELTGVNPRGERLSLIEELVESRIMP